MTNSRRGVGMGKKLILIVVMILFILIQPYRMSAFELQKVIDFGSDEEHGYIFFKAGPISADDDGNIYVVDSERCVIRKYSKKGIFLKEVGAKGQGPKEFLGISGIVVWKESLLIYDYINKRLSQYNFDLEQIQSSRLLDTFSTRMACNRDYLLFNRWEDLKGGIMMVRPFTDWKKLIIPNHDFGKYKKHKRSPLFYAYFHYIFSVNPETGGFVTALRCPLSGRPQLFSYNRKGELQSKVKMERIANYSFDERRVDLSRAGQARGKGSFLALIRAFHTGENQVVFSYGYSGTIGNPETVEAGLLLVNTNDGKILGRLKTKEYDIRCIRNGLAYGYIRDADDAELKVGVYCIVL